jgi:hypothetical protein
MPWAKIVPGYGIGMVDIIYGQTSAVQNFKLVLTLLGHEQSVRSFNHRIIEISSSSVILSSSQKKDPSPSSINGNNNSSNYSSAIL